jgi:YjbE family integral membrane protein
MLYSELAALFSVIVIDLVLAGDNAVVVGMAAAGLEREQRRKAIVYGIGAAAVLRVIFALFTTQLLEIIPLVIAGGLLLLWVAWKLWREIRQTRHADEHGSDPEPGGPALAAGPSARPKTFAQALAQIVVADVSMSLDNVIAVAGSAREHPWVLVVGLVLSVALMGAAATVIAGVLKKYPWIAYVGLLLIVWVAVKMIWEGGSQIFETGSLYGHAA